MSVKEITTKSISNIWLLIQAKVYLFDIVETFGEHYCWCWRGLVRAVNLVWPGVCCPGWPHNLWVVFSRSRHHYSALHQRHLGGNFPTSFNQQYSLTVVSMDSVSDNRNNVSQVLITALGSRWQTMQSLLGEATTVLMGFNDFFQISSQALYPHNRKSILCLYKIHFITDHFILPASDDILITSLIQ